MHKHHIIPKHMDGSDDPSNIVELTVEEHAEAHRMLFEKYGRWEDKLAWKGLSGQISNEEVKRQATIKANTGKPRTLETRKKISRNNGMKNPEAAQKTSLGMIGNKNSVGHPNGAANKGHIWITNGVVVRGIPGNEPIPEGFRKGRK